MPSDSGGTRSRSGGMSVSLASPDGRVVGGGVAGLLVAASPVQVWLLYFNCNFFGSSNSVKHWRAKISERPLFSLVSGRGWQFFGWEPA